MHDCYYVHIVEQGTDSLVDVGTLTVQKMCVS